MFVSIDMDNLVFLHKHHDHDTLSALSWLECGTHHSIAVEDTDRAHFLSRLGRLDLCILYKNTTGAELVSQDSSVLRQQLADMVDNMAPSLALAAEVTAQVESVDERIHAGERFRYALGARVPAQPQELFPLRAKPLTDDQLTLSTTRAAQRVTQQPASSTPAPQGHAPAPGAASPAPRPRATSVRPVIWAHADKVWEAEGRPTDRPVVMELRKRIMAELESEGVKRTSSSNELGNWMKARLG